MSEFNELIGKTIISIVGKVGDDEMIFNTSDGKQYKLFHYQDCCESVTIEDIIGDIGDLIGNSILLAEEVSNNENPVGYVSDGYQDSFTWTFYKLATIKGSVTIRWYGESNGYYSESVDFCEVTQ